MLGMKCRKSLPSGFLFSSEDRVNKNKVVPNNMAAHSEAEFKRQLPPKTWAAYSTRPLKPMNKVPTSMARKGFTFLRFFLDNSSTASSNKHWKKANKSEQQEFKRLFNQLLIRFYTKSFMEYIQKNS